MKFKFLFFLSIILTFSISLSSQSAFPDETQNPKWEYVVWNFWGGACEKRITKTGAKIPLCESDYIEIFDCDENEENCFLIGYYRNQNDSVLVRSIDIVWNGSEYVDTVHCDAPAGLMYDFSALANTDTLHCQLANTYPITSREFWKDQDEMIEYEGVERLTRSMNYRAYINAPNVVYRMDWIYGIGSNVHPFYSLACIGDHCEQELQMTQVFNNGVRIYEDTVLTFSFSCTGWITNNEDVLPEEEGFQLYPNPASSSVTIASDGYLEHEPEVQIFDVQGRSVRKIARYQLDNPINIEDLATGVYVVQVRQREKTEIIKLIID